MTQHIDAGLIFPSPAARPLVKTNVKQLAESMSKIGLINPICVRPVIRHRGTTPFDAYEIVTGHHRYAAALELKWHEIECAIWEGGDLEAELAEIDENLVRANLTPAQEAAAVSRRKEIYELLHPETKHGAYSPNKDCNLQSFVSATAEATGKDKSTVSRAAARGAALGDDLKAVEGTSLDKGVELDALAKKPADERAELIKRAKAGETVTARSTQIDKDIENRAARAVAEWILEHSNGSDLDALKADLFAAKAKAVAIELTNLVGSSIMDRRFA